MPSCKVSENLKIRKSNRGKPLVPTLEERVSGLTDGGLTVFDFSDVKLPGVDSRRLRDIWNG